MELGPEAYAYVEHVSRVVFFVEIDEGMYGKAHLLRDAGL